MLLALGVVFGDIGTSPLYAFETALSIAGADAAIGVASLICWTLFIVVGIKYVLLAMRTDCHGEGGCPSCERARLCRAEKIRRSPGGDHSAGRRDTSG